MVVAAPALGTPQNMNMGTAARAFKEAGDENLGPSKDNAANRAYPLPISPQAVYAAPDMHEPVFTAVQGRESRRAYQFSGVQLGRTHRAGLGFTGKAFTWRLRPLSFSGGSSQGREADTDKESIAEPEQGDSGN